LNQELNRYRVQLTTLKRIQVSSLCRWSHFTW